MSDIDDAKDESEELLRQVSGLLAGHDRAVQGYVLAEATAIWIAGHHSSIREHFFTQQLEAIRGLIKIWSPVLWPKRQPRRPT